MTSKRILNGFSCFFPYKILPNGELVVVRIGIKADQKIIHDVCSEIKGQKVFLVRTDGKEHTIYKAK